MRLCFLFINILSLPLPLILPLPPVVVLYALFYEIVELLLLNKFKLIKVELNVLLLQNAVLEPRDEHEKSSELDVAQFLRTRVNGSSLLLSQRKRLNRRNEGLPEQFFSVVFRNKLF